MERRILTEEEKEQVRSNFNNLCYLCETSLEGYGPDEIEYDHIYAYADGYPQELSNFAAVHASSLPGRRNCHRDKGRKSPYEYKEELRIQQIMEGVTGLKDLCASPEPVDFEINLSGRTIRFGEKELPLYSQHIDGMDNWYFFHEVPIRHIETDTKIQLRPLEPKIYPLIANFRHSVQLLPCVGRLDTEEKVVKIFDGQHKAVAQIVGNQRTSIPCMVFLNTDVDALRVTVFEAHTTFLQQRYKRSHIADKLATIYWERVAAYRESIGNPNAPFTEKAILRGETKAQIRQFVLAQIIDEVRNRDEHQFVDRYVAVDRREQRGPTAKPMIWQNFEWLIWTFCEMDAVDTTSDDPQNFRESEVSNLIFILRQIDAKMISGKWNPQVPDSEQHRLSRNYFYDKACTVWIKRLEEALRNAMAQMQGRAVSGPLCYRDEFSDMVKERFAGIVEKLATHGVWLNPAAQPTIAGAYEKEVEQLFDNQSLDWVYLTKL